MSLTGIGTRALLESAICLVRVQYVVYTVAKSRVGRVLPSIDQIIAAVGGGLLAYGAGSEESDAQSQSVPFSHLTVCVVGGALFLGVCCVVNGLNWARSTARWNWNFRKSNGLNPGIFGPNEEEQRQLQKRTKETLKPHRFHGITGQVHTDPQFLGAVPNVKPNDVIFSCDEAMTKKLRRFFHGVLFTKDAVSRLTQRAHDQAVECAEEWVLKTKEQGYAYTGKGEDRLFRRVFIELICNLPKGKVIDPDLMDKLDAMAANIRESSGLDMQNNLEEFVQTIGQVEGSFVHKMNVDGLRPEAVKAMVFISLGATLQNTGTPIQEAIVQCVMKPSIGDKARQEIAEKIAGGETLPNAIRNSAEIRKILHEALRMDPPVRNIDRIERVGDLVNIRDLSRYPGLVGKKPNEFRPDRFDREVQGGSPKFWPSLAFLPFGSGTHVCPGWKLSAEIATQLLGVLLYSYELKQDSTKFSGRVALQPVNKP